MSIHPEIDTYLDIQFLDCEVEGVKERQFIVLYRGDLVARVGVKAEGREFAEMRQLFVDEDAREKGIGRHLVSECVDYASGENCLSLAITIAKCNRGVIPFYTKLGFLPCYKFSDGELVMALSLTGKEPSAP